VRRVSGTAAEVENGLAALREVRLAIDELDAVAGQLARGTANRGGSWEDIGAALKLRTDAAQNAYRRPRCGSAGGSPAEHREADLEGVAGLRR
jgi:hypothetical protein